MKWFKHETDAHTNLKLQVVIEKFGMAAYGYYWVCDELIGLQGENFLIRSNKSWKNYLKKITGVEYDLQDKYLEFFAEINLIDRKALKKGDLYVPKLEERSDDYTKRVRRVSEPTTDNVPLEQNRIDKKRIEDTSFETFWSSYPRKVARKKAEQAWKKVNTSEYDLIYVHIQTSLGSPQWQKDGGQFIPHPTTYLNQERWKDKVDIKSPVLVVKKICRRCKLEIVSNWMQADGGYVHMDCLTKSPEGIKKLSYLKSEVFKSMPTNKK